MSTAIRTMASPVYNDLSQDTPRSGLPQPPKRLRKSLPAPSSGARHLAHTPPLDSVKMFSPGPTQLRTPSKGTIPLPSHLASPNAPLPPVPSSSSAASRPPSRIPSMPSQTPEPPPLRKTTSYSIIPKQTTRTSSRVGRPSLNTSVSSSYSTTKQEPGSTIHQSPPQAQMSKLRTPTSGTYSSGTTQRGQAVNQDPAPVDKRGSDGLESQPSPSRSQNFSDNDGSDSTSATTFEETEDQTRTNRVPKQDASTGVKRAQSTGKEMKGNVIVSLRVRPDDGGDKHAEGEWMVDGRKSLIAYKGKEGGEYIYDNVYTAYDNNAKVYDNSAKRLIRRVMEGYHGTVFAYGMTGTGKTFSMQGTQSAPGVIPLAVRDIFGYIRETPHREFLLRVSYLEIYNEEIRDLLVPVDESITAGKDKIKLREDSKGNVYAMPLKEIIVQSTMQLLGVIAQGDKARRTASTQFNSHSSRSHAVVQIVVESRERAINAATIAKDKKAAAVPGGVRVSTLSLIDLAGSEKASENKDRRTEGAHINKSLLTLGTIISKLSGAKDKDGDPTDKDGKHLPYRDSKLTRLLQSALSGNSLISILCTVKIGSIGGLANHTFETLNTLKFAARAKNNLVSRAKRAEEATGTGDAGSRALLEHYRLEIANLKAQLEHQSQAAAVQEEPKESDTQRHEEQILELQLARTALRQRIENLNNLILSSQSTGVNGEDGTASSMSMHPRLVSFIGSERDLRSSRASERDLRSSRASGMTLGSALDRSSLSSGKTINAQTAGFRSLTRMTNDESPSQEDVGMGWADADLNTLRAQNAALHEDIMSKNAYIIALERKVSLARANEKVKSNASSPVQLAQIEERDAEIRALKAKIADQDAIIAGLIADKARTANAVVENSPVEAAEFPLPPKSRQSRLTQSPVDGTVPFILGAEPNDVRAARVSASIERISPILARHRRARDGNGSDGTNGTRTSKTSKNSLVDSINGPPSAPPNGPLPALNGSATPSSGAGSPTKSTILSIPRPPSGALPSPVDATSKKPRSTSIIGTKSNGAPTSVMSGVHAQRQSVDEASRMLEEMIQDRVERGELVRSNLTGSVRIKNSPSNASQAAARNAVANARKSREGMPLPTLPLKLGSVIPHPPRTDSRASPSGSAVQSVVSPIPSQPSAPLTARRIPLIESSLMPMVGDMDKSPSDSKLERGERENIGLGLHVEGEPI